MQITKIGHCCLLIKEQGKTILTDPGIFTIEQNELNGIDIILITHEHADHFHIDSVKEVLKNNPNAVVVTNTAVSKFLESESISFQILEHGQQKNFGDLIIEGFGNEHAEIYKTIPNVQNTGFLIAEKFYYPGDAFYVPEKSVEILALPTAGPWLKISESIDFALGIKPKKIFPVHDAMLKSPSSAHTIFKRLFEQHQIEFVVPDEDKAMEF